MDSLPNTPRWSFRRFMMIVALFAAGGVMVLIGTYAGDLTEAVRLRLIDVGADCMWFASLGFATAASAERIGGWIGARRGAA